jgi:hypothetical protein
MKNDKVILTPYLLASGAMVAFLVLTITATRNGWGLASDAEALARARGNSGGSVRTGSLHGRNYYGGGPNRGK